MSRQIDLTKKLSKDERKYLEDRDLHGVIAQADGYESEREAQEAAQEERFGDDARDLDETHRFGGDGIDNPDTREFPRASAGGTSLAPGVEVIPDGHPVFGEDGEIENEATEPEKAKPAKRGSK